MVYDKGLAQRVREAMEELPGFSEKKMFGGVCFLLYGNMVCGVLNDEIIVRVGSEKYKTYLTLPYTKMFELTGRPMKGWIVVEHEGHESDHDLARWVRIGVDFSLSLPPK